MDSWRFDLKGMNNAAESVTFKSSVRVLDTVTTRYVDPPSSTTRTSTSTTPAAETNFPALLHHQKWHGYKKLRNATGKHRRSNFLPECVAEQL